VATHTPYRAIAQCSSVQTGFGEIRARPTFSAMTLPRTRLLDNLGLCVPMLYRALSRSQLLRQLATKQFDVNRMIIYDQTGAEYVFTLNSYVQPHSG
jgi:hypothetical protein